MQPSFPRVFVVHGSRFGQSTKIAEAISDTLVARGVGTDVGALTASTAPDPERHDGLVLVTSVRYGHFDPNAKRLLDRYRAWLDSVPTLLVTVSLTARTPAKRDPAVHLYTRKFLAKTGWTPTHVEVVAGALEYLRYNFFDREAIRLIMRMTGGPTDPSTNIEYTDWDQVAATAREFAKVVRARWKA